MFLIRQEFALPTEVQCEYAVLGDNRSRGYKYSGSNNLSEVAWYVDNSNSQIHLVAQKKPNELGLYDMSGNVWEWCNDRYDSNYYQSSPERNPQGPTSGDRRVLRGGGWYLGAGYCRVSLRNGCNSGGRYCYLGMRLSLSSFDENSVNETFLGHLVATF